MNDLIVKPFTFNLYENVEWTIKRAKRLQNQVKLYKSNSPKWEELNDELDDLYAEIGFWVTYDYKP